MRKLPPDVLAENRKRQRRESYRRNRTKALAGVRAWHLANPRRVDEIKRKYSGFPEPTRPEPKTCDCCGKTCSSGRRLALDHCHETGIFRGWLCIKCNTGIGKLGDNLAGLERATSYLKNGRLIQPQGNDQ